MQHVRRGKSATKIRVEDFLSGGERQLAFDASFWLTSFCQCGSLQLSNDGVNSPTEMLLSYTAATSTV